MTRALLSQRFCVWSILRLSNVDSDNETTVEASDRGMNQ
jgi:hypothetical protein